MRFCDILPSNTGGGDEMSRKSRPVPCDRQTRTILERMAGSQKEEIRLVRRARIILGCVDGRRIKDLSTELGEQEDVIIKWRDRFIVKGIAGLNDAPRSGKPTVYGNEWRAMVLAKLNETPPNGMARWDGPTLATEQLRSM